MFNKTNLMIIVSLMFWVIAPLYAADQGAFESGIKRILMKRHITPGVSKVERMKRYTQNSGRSYEEMEQVLISFVRESCDGTTRTTYSRLLCRFSISVLGGLRSRQAIPILKVTMQSNESIVQNVSVVALANMGGSETIDFSREVVSNQDSSNVLNRTTLYKTLIKNLNQLETPKWKEIEAMTKSFLQEMIIRETYPRNLMAIDQYLRKIDDQYRKSEKRQSTLQKMKVSKVRQIESYAAKELDLLK